MQSKDLVNLGISSRFQSPSPKKKMMQSNVNYTELALNILKVPSVV